MTIPVLLLASVLVAGAQVPPPPPFAPPPFSATRATGSTCAVVSPAAARSEFDAVSAKPAGALISGGMGGVSGGPGTSDPGRVTMPRMPLATLVMLAYDLKRDQLSGGPTWIDDGLNDGYAITATMSKATTKEQYCGMLRNLLTDRFHLAIHHATQGRPGYELTVAKGGSKLKRVGASTDSSESSEPASLDASSNRFPKLPPNSKPGLMIAMSPPGAVRMSYRGPLPSFAKGLGPFITWSAGNRGFGDPEARLVDKTGLDGIYEIRLEFAGAPPETPGTISVDSGTAAPNIFDAVTQQLGLKLQKARAVSVDVVIIDHVDRTPTKN